MADTPQLGHEDSISSQDPNLHDDKTKTKNRRPASENSTSDAEGKRALRLIMASLYRYSIPSTTAEGLAVSAVLEDSGGWS
jgi:hypothetical protein